MGRIMRKQTKSSLTRKLDVITSEIVRSRGFCQRCGKTNDTLQCCHIYSRTYRGTRWLLDNCLCMCASCHFYTHKNPLEFAQFVNNYLGYEKVRKLTETKEKLTQYKLSDLEELYQLLTKYRDNLYAK